MIPPKPEGELFVFLKESLKIATVGIANPFIETFIKTNYYQNLEIFLNDLVSEIEYLSLKITEYSFDNLLQNEEFITIFVRCVEVARRNHKEEKREYLKNAIINSVRYKSSTDLSQIFIRYIDELNVDQIQLLKNIADNPEIIGVPDSYKTFHTRYNRDIAKISYPVDVLAMYLNDLKSKGLIDINPGYQNINYSPLQLSVQHGARKPNMMILNLAHEFLDFILKTPKVEK